MEEVERFTPGRRASNVEMPCSFSWIRKAVLSPKTRNDVELHVARFRCRSDTREHKVDDGRNKLFMGILEAAPELFHLDLLNGPMFHSGKCSAKTYGNCILRPPSGKRLPMVFCRWLSRLPETQSMFWNQVRQYFAEWCERYQLENAWVNWRAHPDAGDLRYNLNDVQLPELHSAERGFSDRVTCSEIFALYSFPDVLQAPHFILLVSLRDICDSCASLLQAFYVTYGWFGLEVVSQKLQQGSLMSSRHRKRGEAVFDIKVSECTDFDEYHHNDIGLVGTDEANFWLHFSMTP